MKLLAEVRSVLSTERALALAAVVVLFAALGFTFAHAFLVPYSGMVYQTDWIVIATDSCNSHPGWCEANPGAIQVGDQLLDIGGLSHRAYLESRTRTPFRGYEPGDLVPVVLRRDGKERTVDWLLPPVSLFDRLPRFSGLLISLPFWVAGTLVLVLLRPRDQRWQLLILFFYLTSLWLASGSVSSENLALSSHLTHLLSWLMAPVFIHLHLAVPHPLPRQRPYSFLAGLYAFSALLAVLDTFELLPSEAFFFPVLLAIGGSLGLLVFRAFYRPTPSERITHRLMLAGIALAFGPGIVTFVIPSLFHTELFGLSSLLITVVALPILPVFYTYAIFKRRFRDLEFRANRLIGWYGFLLVYLTVFTLVMLLGNQLIRVDQLKAFLNIAVPAAFIVAAPALRARFQATLDRLAYGAVHNPDEILALFSNSIPATPDQEVLVGLLRDEIAPSLFIRQSALYLFGEGGFRTLYTQGVPTGITDETQRTIHHLMAEGARYQPPSTADEGGSGWVRLAVPLAIRERTIGVWLFGRRDPDDYYPQSDIHLLRTLANQVALAVENARLYAESRKQMDELAGLYDIALATGSVLDTDVLLQRLYEQVSRSIALDTFAVSLFDPSSDEVEIALAVENGAPLSEFNGMRLRLDEAGLTGWVIRSGRSLLINDMEAEVLPVEPRHMTEPANSWVGVPLVARERLIGSVSIQSFKPNAFKPADRRFLEILAGQVAIALENAILFEEARQRALRQEALNAVIAAASIALELPVLLELALNHSLKALKVDRGVVWVENPTLQQSRGLPKAYSHVATRAIHVAGFVVNDWDHHRGEAKWDELAEAMRRFGVRASLSVPLLAEGRRIGGLGLVDSRPRRWSQEEVALAHAIGQQLGGAVERLRLLEQIQEKARQVQRILDTVREGILTLDVDGRIIMTNPVATTILKLVADAEIGDVLSELGGRPLSEFLIDQPSGLPHKIEWVAGEETRVYEVLASPFSSGGGDLGWTLLIRDVTQVEQVQQRAQQQDRLAAVGQLAAGIAHDFNNIMAAIILYAEMMLQHPEITEKGRERLATILQQAQHAAMLTRQILDFSRRSVMEHQPLDLIPFLKELEKLLARTLPESISKKLIYDDQDYILQADPSRLQQVFMNLALNARDAMPTGGELRFELSHVHLRHGDSPQIRDLPPGEWIRVIISDTGCGIPTEVLPHIFEPFFTTKAPGVGTGLGLAQVYGIIKQHNGYIEVESELNEGTTFTLFLPALPTVELTGPTGETGELIRGQGETILVVEDDSATREGVREVLEALNYNVLVAIDGKEALDLYGKNAERIDLIITDLVMPDVGGMTLYQKLKERQPTVKVVMMTGYPLGEGTRELLDRGSVIWLQKPLSTKTLCETVFHALTDEAKEDA